LEVLKFSSHLYFAIVWKSQDEIKEFSCLLMEKSATRRLYLRLSEKIVNKPEFTRSALEAAVIDNLLSRLPWPVEAPSVSRQTVAQISLARLFQL
jgi:hypothetical protein